MAASELIDRYISGERDFSAADLRATYCKGRDLSKTDFSEAIVHYSDFTRANLASARACHQLAIEALLVNDSGLD